MGLIKGSGSFTRFFVDSKPIEKDPDAISERIARFSFRNLDEYSSEERSTGWVNITDIFNTDFDSKSFFMPPYILLSWRVDIRKVPREALRERCLEAEKEIKEREELEYIPKERRRELKGFILSQLLKRAIPRTLTYDMIWNFDTSMLILGSTNDKLCDEFSELFSRTFDITLSPVFPYSLAYHYLENEGIKPEILDSILPSVFSGGDN